MTFHRILIANRGEIACRVIRSAHALGFDAVALFTDADEGAPHVALADEAVRIGEGPAASSYLDIDKVIGAAKSTGCGAIHPGYGFLSERAELAEACRAAGIVFIGPSPEAIVAMGDKARAKRLMREAEVPCLPGYDGDEQTADRLEAEARTIGFPLLVKAAAGGGGRGMRRVDEPGELRDALDSAKAEAKAAFGNDAVLLEKLVVGGRHIEVQVLADTHGTTLYLGERDCSTQRRHQKVIEEAPSPFVDASLRERLGQAAVRAARAVSYVGAGTVEFLVDAEGHPYFLEMNTRLQVEHPVTELVTGLDLVALQLEIASGKPLPMTQEDIELDGHAIEVRLYAEDVASGFLPQTGTALRFEPGLGEGIRCDAGLVSGQAVSPFYDSMVAKLIAYGEDRDEAIRRLLRSLRTTVLLGISNNRQLLLRILDSEDFRSGAVTTAWLEAHLEALLPTPEASTAHVAMIAAILATGRRGPAESPLRFSHDGPIPVDFTLGDRVISTQVTARGAGRYTIAHGDHEASLRVVHLTEQHATFELDGRRCHAQIAYAPDALHFTQGAHDSVAILPRPAERRDDAVSDGSVVAPMTGRVLSVQIAVGDVVASGAKLFVVEAMKMETTVTAKAAGTVAEVRASPGDQVERGKLVVRIELKDAEKDT